MSGAGFKIGQAFGFLIAATLFFNLFYVVLYYFRKIPSTITFAYPFSLIIIVFLIYFIFGVVKK